jgi:dipeptidyl aminopeptidase/acylaminoacyl peptidase
LLAVNQSRLLAWKLNLAEGRVDGDPVTLNAVLVGRNLGNQVRLFSVSQTGVLAVRRATGDDVDFTGLEWFDRAGVPGASLKLDRHCRNPELSPTGDRVALECLDGTSQQRDIWLYDLARNVASRFTVNAADDADPLWSPDGRTIVFASDRLGTVDVFQKAVGGASEEQLVLETIDNTPTMSWSPDGHTIALLTATGGLSVFDFVKHTPAKPMLASQFLEIEFQFSPDGHWFSYSSDESGRAEVYMQRWPPSGDKWQVSIDGGTDARWRADGKELFYLSPTKALMAAPIDLAPTPRIGAPAKLFDTRIAGPLGSGQRFPYAVSRDGKRFLLYVSLQNRPAPAIEVTVNWPALVAAKKTR